MSGGSWDYVYHRFQEVGDQLVQEKCPKRKALGLLVQKLAEAMHDIEWVDSHDKGAGAEMESINAALNFNARQAVLKCAIEESILARDRLEEAILEARDHQK